MSRTSFGPRSDLDQPWPRRRALLWVVLCATLGIASVVMAFVDDAWHLLLIIPFYALSGTQTTRRLRGSRGSS